MGQLAERISNALHHTESSTQVVRERGPWLFLAAPISFALTLITVMLLAR